MRHGIASGLVCAALLALVAAPAASAAPGDLQPGTFGAVEAQWTLAGGGIPSGVAVDSAGNVYVADLTADVVRKFDPDGQPALPATFGSFDDPHGVAVDPAGNVYVADTNNDRVQEFDPTGSLVRTFGAAGSGQGELQQPEGVTFNRTLGELVVADTGNDRIERFNPDGTFATQLAVPGPKAVAYSAVTDDYVATGDQIVSFNGNAQTHNWGSTGSGDGDFDAPSGVAADLATDVYVVDRNNERVQKSDFEGTFLGKWGTPGSGPGQFDQPRGIAVDQAGNVYVADTGNARIQKFGPTTLAYTEGDGSVPLDPGINTSFNGSPDGATVKIASGFHSGEDVLTFTPANGITGSSSGDTLTLTGAGDPRDYRDVLRTVRYRNDSTTPSPDNRDITFTLSQSGTPGNSVTRTVSVTPVNSPPAVAPGTFGTFESKWGSQGTGPGQFASPQGIAVNAAGESYVSDIGNNNVQKFDSSGQLIAQWNGSSSGQMFSGPRGVALDRQGDVYVADTGRHRVKVFDPSGAFLRGIGSQGTGDGQFNFPAGITVDDARNVYVTAFARGVQKFDSEGHFIREWGPNGTSATSFSGAGGAVATDHLGHVYVADAGDSLVYRFDSDGGNALSWGSSGSGDGQFGLLNGLAVDGVGRVYVSDQNNHRIQVFDSTGTFLGKWFTQDGGDGQTQIPQAVALDGGGRLYVTDGTTRRVQRFGPSTLAYTENDGPLTVDPLLLVADPDSADLTAATVKIGAGFGAGDLLAFTPVNGITGSFTGDTLTLTGTATPAEYQAVLRSVTYRSTSEDPSGATRQIAFSVNDGNSNSAAVTRAMAVTPVNDRPALQTSGGATAFAEGSGPATVDGGLTAADPDSSLVSAQARIAGGFQAGDVLAVADGNGISTSYDSSAGVLTLTGTATPAQYEAALRSVTFSTPSQSPGTTRTVEFKVSDGALDSNLATKDIAVASVEDLPVAVDDSKTVVAGSAATGVDVLANDTDADGGTKAVGSMTQPAHGTAAITTAGAGVTYKPKAKYCNSGGPQRDTFKYTLNGGSEATVSVKVTCPGLKITHPEVNVTKRGALVGLDCRGAATASCAGTVTLLATNRKSRFKLAAAGAKPVKFSIAGGKSKRVRIKVPAKSRKQLAKKHKAVAQVAVRLSSGGSVKRYITLHGR